MEHWDSYLPLTLVLPWLSLRDALRLSSACQEARRCVLRHVDRLSLKPCVSSRQATLVVQKFSALQRLNLVRCRIVTSDLRIIAEQLPRLQSLALGGDINGFTRSWRWLLSLTNLCELTLVAECTSSSESVHFHSLSALQSLTLRSCLLCSLEGLGCFSNCTKLHTLDLAHTRGEPDLSLQHLSSFAALTRLSLEACALKNDCLAHCTALSALQSLNLARNFLISADGLRHLSSFRSLRHLNLTGCARDIVAQNPDDPLPHLTTLTGLHHFSMQRCLRFGDVWLTRLAQRLTSLCDLDIAWSAEVTSKGVANLTGLTQLTKLDLSRTRVDDEGLPHLARMTALRRLGLNYCRWLTSDRLVLLRSLSQLQQLSLVGVVTGEPMATLISTPHAFPVLQELEVSLGCTFGDNSLSNLTNLASLTYLCLCNANNTRTPGLHHLAHLMDGLQIPLARRRRIVAEDLAHLTPLSGLRKLVITDCEAIEGGGLLHLSGLQELRELHLTGCCSGAEDGLAPLTNLRELRELSMVNCTCISDACLPRLAALSTLEDLLLLDVSGSHLSANVQQRLPAVTVRQ